MAETDGMCTIGGVYKIVEENKIGRIKNIQYPKDRPWFGFIGPVESTDKNIIFGVVSSIKV